MSSPRKADILASVEIWEVLLDNSTIKFKKPLVLMPQWLLDDPEEPRLPDEKKYLFVEFPDLNISTAADNRDDLLEFIHSDIRFAWRRIVQVPDDLLDAASKVIKNNYLALAEEVDA